MGIETKRTDVCWPLKSRWKRKVGAIFKLIIFIVLQEAGLDQVPELEARDLPLFGIPSQSEVEAWIVQKKADALKAKYLV